VDLNWATVITAALDEVEYGIVLLDHDFQARFINRAFHDMWALPRAPEGTIYGFADLVAHGRKTGAYEIASEAMEEFVQQRIALVAAGSQPPMQLRLADGRILKCECIALPDGGRMLTYADISDLVHTAEQLRELATVDDLTKLLNRRQFLASLNAAFDRSVRNSGPLSVLMIDADNFKKVNDRYGHSTGDEVLRAIAERCRSVVRQADIVGRVGGEEFAAALADTDLPGGLRTAERLRQVIAQHPVEVGGNQLSVTVSLGVAERAAAIGDPGQLLKLADRALYAAKAGGRNRVVAYEDA
jgi:diguanylate cyclase (GGDEF)-like protein